MIGDVNGPPDPEQCSQKVSVEEYVSFALSRSIAMSVSFVQQYITRDLGAIHYCYTAKCDRSGKRKLLFGEHSLLSNSHVSDVQLHLVVKSRTPKQN